MPKKTKEISEEEIEVEETQPTEGIPVKEEVKEEVKLALDNRGVIMR